MNPCSSTSVDFGLGDAHVASEVAVAEAMQRAVNILAMQP